MRTMAEMRATLRRTMGQTTGGADHVRNGVSSRHRFFRPRRLLFVLLGGLLILVGAPLAIVGWPNLAFPHRLEQSRFVVRSDAPFDPELLEMLADVEARLQALEIDRPEIGQRLFLCRSSRLYRFFARLLGVSPSSQGIKAPLVDSIFISLPFLDEMKERYGPRFRYSLVEGDLAHVITHEIVHALVEEELGFLAARRLPHWKAEGFCEYAAVKAAVTQDRADSLAARYERFQALERTGIGAVRLQYVRGQLLTEYLMAVEGWTARRFLTDPIEAEEVHGQLMDFLADQANQVGPDP